MTQPYDAWNFAVVARFFWKKKIVHAPLVLNFLGLDLRGNWVSHISRQHFPQILQWSPLIPYSFVITARYWAEPVGLILDRLEHYACTKQS